MASPRPKKKANPHANGAPVPAPPPKPLWVGDAWTRKEVEAEEIQELLRGCTIEMKSRALDMPFLLLPFRPASDPSAARTFIRNFFSMEKGTELKGERLEQELILTEPMVCTISDQPISTSDHLTGGKTCTAREKLFHTLFELSHSLKICLERGMLWHPLRVARRVFRVEDS